MIPFTKAELPYGWLGNMAGGYPIQYEGFEYNSSETLFQYLRFAGVPEAQEAIRTAPNGFVAKKYRAVPHKAALKVTLRDQADLGRMRFCLVLKLRDNPRLIAQLIATDPKQIVEDCSSRPNDIEIDGSKHTPPFWGAMIAADGTLSGTNALGKLWMEIREELRTKGAAVAVSPKGDKIEVFANARVGGRAAFEEPVNLSANPLTTAEQGALSKHEEEIEAGQKEVVDGFARMVRAMYAIYEKQLYRENGRTFAEYFRTKWNFERAHAYRLIHCGRLLDTMTSAVAASLTTQAHFRPLLAAEDDDIIQAAVVRIEDWKQKIPGLEVTPSLVESATVAVQPAPFRGKPPTDPELPEAKVLALVAEAQAQVAKDPKTAAQALENLQTAIRGLGETRTTGINWATASWNPLQGCKKISAGCQFCYAATLLATRLKGRYPGIAKKGSRAPKGSSPYDFTGKLLLLADALSEPLGIKTPRRYFVNSLSDLFWDQVPNWFVDEVFGVMEKAPWHHFQVLTKRPERMAKYTKLRYAKRQPPPHIWLGATIENQDEHDRRMPHLKEVVTAVRWVSCEPLLGAIKFNLDDIHWVVVGGESASHREMKQAWAIGVRDQCRAAKVPFFFKQWGNFDEDGKPNKHPDEDEMIAGEILHELPASPKPEVRLYGKNTKTPKAGQRSYWTDIEAWKMERLKETGMAPQEVNVTTRTKEWSRELSPFLLGPVDTYCEKQKMLQAVSVEVAWQYSKIYNHKLEGEKLVALDFQQKDGSPNAKWFTWRDAAFGNPEFKESHPQFKANKHLVRRAFPKGSTIAAWYWDGRVITDPVEARREIYATLYCREVKRSKAFAQLQGLNAKGDVAIFDMDGYDYLALGMSPDDTIRDLNHSWGHGLLLTLMLRGIDPCSLGKSAPPNSPTPPPQR